MANEVKISRQEMSRILATQRHKDILYALSNLMSTLNQREKLGDMQAFIAKNNQLISKIIEKIGELTPPIIPAPMVSVTTNQDETIQAINKMTSDIVDALSRQQIATKKEYEFEIIRGSFNRIERVKVVELNR